MTGIEADELGSRGQRLDEPLYFPAGAHTLFGWLHRPHGVPTADVGLVICKPFGYEAICAHRSVRLFADAAAAVGVPALRFDYAGTGNSEDLPRGTEELSVWVEDVLAAARELQRRTAVARIGLLGIRLGALLATLAAAKSEAITALALIAPVLSGPRYLRELRTVQLAASEVSVVTPTQATASEESRETDDPSFEVSGFALSSATIEAIAHTDLTCLNRAPAARILMIDRDDLPGARGWSEALARLGADIEYQALAGIVQLVWTAPHYGVTPQAMIAATAKWVGRLAVTAPPQSDARVPAGQRAIGPQALVLRPADRGGATAIERPIFFAPDPLLFGVVTEPPAGQSRHRGVVLINDGATYHVGANRMNVMFARRWVRLGYTVLRMDLAGLGESSSRPGQPLDDVFPPRAIEDIGIAVNFLRTECRCTEITLGGLCSGAYHALRAATGGVPVDRILLMNPQNFFWDEDRRIDDLQLIEIVRGPSRYLERMLSSKNWRKLLRGHADVRYILRIAIRHAWFKIATWLQNCAKRLHVRLLRDLGRELEGIVARGTRVVFVFARGEVGLELLRIQAGSSLERLGERCRIHLIDGADHIFSQSRPRQTLENILSDELLGRTAQPSARSEEALPRGPHVVV